MGPSHCAPKALKHRLFRVWERALSNSHSGYVSARPSAPGLMIFLLFDFIIAQVSEISSKSAKAVKYNGQEFVVFGRFNMPVVL